MSEMNEERLALIEQAVGLGEDGLPLSWRETVCELLAEIRATRTALAQSTERLAAADQMAVMIERCAWAITTESHGALIDSLAAYRRSIAGGQGEAEPHKNDASIVESEAR